MADLNRAPASGRAYWVPGLPVVWALSADAWPETGVTLGLLDDDGTTVTTITPTIDGTVATWSLSGVQTATGATRYRVQIDGGYPIQADEIVTLTGWHGRGTGSVNLGTVIVGPTGPAGDMVLIEVEDGLYSMSGLTLALVEPGLYSLTGT